MPQGDYCAGCGTTLDRTEQPVVADRLRHHNHICVEARRIRQPKKRAA